MLIKDIFQKDIDRPIQGVIKVGQKEEENIRQELEEYVVTDELAGHFKSFFAAYKNSINTSTDKMGVWISGFFGSGKSHFLKILSYLLENKVIDGKTALDYFKEDLKIKSLETLSNMEEVSRVKTDVMLFNIDSKGDVKKTKEGLVSVFLKVFYDMQGYYGSNPNIAEFEIDLEKKGKLESFKNAFLEIQGTSWEEERNGFAFFFDEIKEALLKIDYASEDSLNLLLERLNGDHNITIEEFAYKINEYIKTKGEDHHVAFLIDEVGQYIGDNRDLTLNLQTIVENLGAVTGGKAWVIVTSQEAIDEVTTLKSSNSGDFSKIKDRFATSLSLSSANADEVIKKRILKKQKETESVLLDNYENKKTEIKNKIDFKESVELKLYRDENDFVEVYPFVPYQFNLLSSILTAIRKHSYSGSNLSSGERSLLAMFKETADTNKDGDLNSLVSLDMFYEKMERWLDASWKGVITKASNNEELKSEDGFIIRVLKTLFMIKYVSEDIKPCVDNIASLMITSVDEDKHETREKVEKALQKLIRQNLVQKNADKYIFLTDTEQDTNREIQAQKLQPNESLNKLKEIVFDDILNGQSNFKSSYLGGRYIYAYNRFIDGSAYGTYNNEMRVEIISPEGDLAGDTTRILLENHGGKVIHVEMLDKGFIDDLTWSIKIQKYLTQKASDNSNEFMQIRLQKSAEAQELKETAILGIKEALNESIIYHNENKISTAVKDFKLKLNQALEQMISLNYSKLDYVNAAKEDKDILEVLNSTRIKMELNDNVEAVNEVLRYIGEKSRLHETITIRSIKKHFVKRAPYGWVEKDLEWVLAKLYKQDDIDIKINNSVIAGNTDSKTILSFLSNSSNADKVTLERREKATDKQKKVVNSVMKELFNTSLNLTKSDNDVMDEVKRQFKGLLEKLESYKSTKEMNYPDQKFVTDSIALLNIFMQIVHSSKFFTEFVDKENLFDNVIDNLSKVQKFHEGSQKTIWEKARGNQKLITSNGDTTRDDSLTKVVDEMDTILKMSKPYGQLARLNELNEDFTKIYYELLTRETDRVLEDIATYNANITLLLEGKECREKLEERAKILFDVSRRKSKMETMNKVEDILAESVNAKRQYEDFSVEISKYEDEIQREKQRQKLAEEKQRKLKEAKANGNDAFAETITEESEIVIKEKISKTIRLTNLRIPAQNIETEEDIENFTNLLRQKLKEELKEDTKLTVLL